MTERFDDIVIGTGQAGPPLAVRLAQAGRRVAIVERDRFGGTCVNNGCTPTKTLVASAFAAQVARRAAEYGVLLEGGVRVDMRLVKARKDAIAQRASAGVERWLRDTAGVTVLRGHARFDSPDKIRVEDRLLAAQRVFINVGGRPLVPSFPGIHEVPYLTNVSMMDLDVLPEHLVVIGGSYVGLEFAQMYRRFGAQVTVVEKLGRVVSREDPDVSDAIREVLESEGIRVETDANCIGFQPRAGRIGVHLDCGDGRREVVGTHVLVAVGRVPNTDGLGLDKAGVRTDARGYIVVDESLCTNVDGIYALGDCNGRGAFTHTAYNDYEIVADNLLDGAARRVGDRVMAYALYIDPPLARVGMTDAEVRKSNRRALTGMRPMTRVARAVEKGETRGFVKVTVDAQSEQILGAAILGAGADEAVHCLIDAMHLEARYTDVRRAMHIHPTLAELIPTVLQELKPLH